MLREKIRAYRRAFEGTEPRRRWARIGAALGLGPALRFMLSDSTWLSIVLADLERFCHARDDQTTYVDEDPTGRAQAQLEGRRQVYMRLRAYIAMTPAEEGRLYAALLAEELEEQRNAA